MKIKNTISGQSLVEFALTLPLLLVMVMGLFDIGRAVFYYAVLNTAVREGSRFAVVQPECDYLSNPGSCTGSHLDTYPLNCANATSKANHNICSEVTEKFFHIGELADSNITINHVALAEHRNVINIQIQHLFRPITPGLGLIGELPIRVQSQMLRTPFAQ